MFYEYYCLNCDLDWLVNKPISEVEREEKCRLCDQPLARLFSTPQVHMNRMVAEGYRRTDEPPDDLKPDGYHKKLRDEIENIPHMTSYPDKATKRRRGMTN